MIKLIQGDCLEVMAGMADNSVDAIITDPPYELGFMGKKWDGSGIAYNVDVWREALRVLKPGGHLLAFGGTRTYHRMTCAIEDAGFEIRDMAEWLYGSGFPKSHNISKAIDKAAGAEREIIGVAKSQGGRSGKTSSVGQHLIDAGKEFNLTAPATPEAQQWDGWGTALKPAHEPICVARKPLSERTIAANVLEWGTAGLNIDGCRVETNGEQPSGSGNPSKHASREAIQPGRSGGNGGNVTPARGRWPANLIHDGSDEVLAVFPKTSKGSGKPTITARQRKASWRKMEGREDLPSGSGLAVDNYGDSGLAARFFYCAKASKRDRDEGLDALPEQKWVQWQTGNGASGKPSSMSEGRNTAYRNTHPTVKPTDLMRYLCRLVTPPDGVVLDPFMGSGSTGKAAVLEGFSFIGIDKTPEYFPIAERRIAWAQEQEEQPALFGGAA